ncbi:MAG TPA: hypothetical protein VMH34_10590 [Gammaproteobacteria bacterium]|nr:hypothetical protein [Gammaproteobacteria bacterium]
MFERYQFLNSEECRRTADAVHALRTHWEQRHAEAPFYTLGAASYLDATDPAARKKCYYDKAARLNPLLEKDFEWLYAKLSKSLAEHLGGACAFERRAGRPGFHIFMPTPLFRQSIASIHVDLQYQLIDWRDHPHPDFEKPISFTASIVLPRGGGGLHTWDIRYEKVRGLPIDEIAKRVHSTAPAVHRYVPGGMVVHSGHTVHQIAPMPDIEPGNPLDARITLQGHAIRSEGTWWLYW